MKVVRNADLIRRAGIVALLPFFLTAAVAARASAEPRDSTKSTAIGVAPTASRDLRVHLINEAGAAPQTLDAAAAEAATIWAGVGLRLTWSFGVPVDPFDGRTVVVIVRRALPQPPGLNPADPHHSSHPPLGWLVFDENGRPGNTIEVSFEALTSVVMLGSKLGKPIDALPDLAKRPLLGRGLGRVVAHEIGHWLMGRGHTRQGLMKALLSVRDLLDWRAARLPRAWTAAGSELRLALLSRCELAASHPCAR